MSDAWIRDAAAPDLPVMAAMVVAEAREAEDRLIDPAVVSAALTAAFRDPALARYWLAVDSGTVLGMIGVVREWSDWNNAAYWWIQNVFVVPEARRRGLVELLIDHVKRAASAAGAPELRLYVHTENARAIRTYGRLGFAAAHYHILAQPIARGADAAVVLDDDELWRAFHDRTLSHAQWTHAAHLRIAWLHLARYPLDEAHLRMRAGILRLNATHGLIETPERGYHETLTRVWLALIGQVQRRDPGGDSRGLVELPELARTAPLAYYSRDRLFSLAARAMFVPPDLAALPQA